MSSFFTCGTLVRVVSVEKRLLLPLLRRLRLRLRLSNEKKDIEKRCELPTKVETHSEVRPTRISVAFQLG